jgi:flavin-dependent dehydrogenase
MKIGIIGARLAGSYSALILSQLQHQVLMFDPAPEREKPCGGGMTAKALLTMPWLRDQAVPHNVIRTVELNTLDGCRASVTLSQPIHVFSRSDLDAALRDAAIQAGTRFFPERAASISPGRNGWSITTSTGACHEVEFLVGADGARSSVRAQVSGKLASGDLALALGYYLPGSHHPNKAVIVFQEAGFQGYLWSFPRVDHASIGIVHGLLGVRAADLHRRVREFISLRYPGISPRESSFFAACVPCLTRRTLLSQRTCGRDWALLGDAAGFVDAITSEGIYFALRSAEILADSLRSGDPQAYDPRWRRDFGSDLERAAAWHDEFYAPSLLIRPLTHRSVRMNRRSKTVQGITDRLISGHLTYKEMRLRLLLQSPRILAEWLHAVASGL